MVQLAMDPPRLVCFWDADRQLGTGTGRREEVAPPPTGLQAAPGSYKHDFPTSIPCRPPAFKNLFLKPEHRFAPAEIGKWHYIKLTNLCTKEPIQ